MDTRHIAINAQLVGPTRTEVLMGVEYTVIPAVLVRAQVLNNNLGATLLPPEDITPEWAETANVSPVIIGDHPTRLGQQVSARATDILDARGAGSLFHAKAEGRALKADVYLNHSRVGDVDGLDDVLERHGNGEIVELSTGFMVAIEERSGTFEGEPYDMVIHPSGFDHLAVFGGTELVGACSVDDGCGLGANASVQIDEHSTSGEDEKMKESGPLARAAAAISGFVNRMLANESDGDRDKLLRAELQGKFGGIGQEIWITDVFSEEGEVVFEVWGPNEESGFWRTTFEIDEGGVVTLGEPAQVRRVTTYEPVENSAGPSNSPANAEEAAMDRQKLIAQLSGECPKKLAFFEGLKDEDLENYQKVLGNTEPGEGGEAVVPAAAAPVVPEAEAVVTEPEEDGTASAIQSLTEQMKALTSKIETMGEAVAPAVQERQAAHGELVAELAANEKAPYTEEELKPKGLEELRKIQAMARGANYSGVSGPKAANAEEESPFMQVADPHWDTAKPKEA